MILSRNETNLSAFYNLDCSSTLLGPVYGHNALRKAIPTPLAGKHIPGNLVCAYHITETAAYPTSVF